MKRQYFRRAGIRIVDPLPADQSLPARDFERVFLAEVLALREAGFEIGGRNCPVCLIRHKTFDTAKPCMIKWLKQNGKL